jgi:dTDP-glucose 4,6-dehydratase
VDYPKSCSIIISNHEVELVSMQPLPARDLRHILDTARADLVALDGTRLFLSGGTGFLGRWLVESWAMARTQGLLRGELVVLTRYPGRWSAALPPCPGLSFAGGDQVDFPFPDGRFDGVVHGAVEHGDALTTFGKNLRGCARMLEAARHGGASRFLLLSSGAVYGAQELERVPETWTGAPDPLDPGQAYGAAKRACEAMGAAAMAAGGLAFVSARGFAFLGPGLPLDRNYAVGNFIRDALGGGPIAIQGDGTPLRSYLYAADAAAWLWALLVRGGAGRAYNVGSPQALSILQLAQRVRDVLAPGAEIRVAGKAIPGQAPARYVPDTGRAETELGLRGGIGLEEGIIRTADWCRERKGP